MAYIKTHELNSGLAGNYWRITEAKVDKLGDKVVVIYSLYATKELRLAGKQPIATKRFAVPLASIDISKDLFEECYKATKNAKEAGNQIKITDAYFTDAEVDL